MSGIRCGKRKISITIKHDFISYFGHFCTKYAVKECFFHANYKEVTAYGG